MQSQSFALYCCPFQCTSFTRFHVWLQTRSALNKEYCSFFFLECIKLITTLLSLFFFYVKSLKNSLKTYPVQPPVRYTLASTLRLLKARVFPFFFFFSCERVVETARRGNCQLTTQNSQVACARRWKFSERRFPESQLISENVGFVVGYGNDCPPICEWCDRLARKDKKRPLRGNLRGWCKYFKAYLLYLKIPSQLCN